MESARANTRVVSGVRATHAGTAVGARRPQAVVHQIFTFRSSEPFRAFARVATLSRVEACTAVPAGLVVRAEVQILVAEKAAPSLVAHAVPRFRAAAVDATRVPLALVAERSFPSRLTPVNKKKTIDKTTICILLLKQNLSYQALFQINKINAL